MPLAVNEGPFFRAAIIAAFSTKDGMILQPTVLCIPSAIWIWIRDGRAATWSSCRRPKNFSLATSWVGKSDWIILYERIHIEPTFLVNRILIQPPLKIWSVPAIAIVVERAGRVEKF